MKSMIGIDRHELTPYDFEDSLCEECEGECDEEWICQDCGMDNSEDGSPDFEDPDPDMYPF